MKRTQQTAAPLAVAMGAGVTRIPAEDVTALVEKVKSETGNVLIIGHSNTIPKILAGLGVQGTIEIGDNEYDNLFIVIRGTPTRLLRLRYE
jgi:phosphohistidine phosphatase SixA